MMGKVFSCDICGARKKETNHWFLGFTLSGGTIEISKWVISRAEDSSHIHLCGEQCVAKWVLGNLPK